LVSHPNGRTKIVDVREQGAEKKKKKKKKSGRERKK
jgi:hypothetical protein